MSSPIEKGGYPADYAEDLKRMERRDALVLLGDVALLATAAAESPEEYNALRRAVYALEQEMTDDDLPFEDDPEPYVGDDGGTCQDEDGRFAPLHGLDGSGG